MATVNITNRYENQQKRYAEAVVATLPSQLEEGGVRLSTPPVLAQFDDDHVISTVEPDTIVKKCYLIIDEAFPALSTITVTVGATTFHTAVDGTVVGLVASATEDVLFTAGADITITVGGGTGDITSGLARVVLDTDSPSLNNGNYAAYA